MLATPISKDDPSWPVGLNDLADPPTSLEVAGRWPSAMPTLAIVGTRRPTDEAVDVTRSIARDLSRAGVLIVSGGAVGIDAAAHAGALDAGGPTVAVLGTPLQAPYPREHAPLFSRIAERGAVVSETRNRDWVNKASFLARNRLIAAASHAVLVVQAPHRSGALSTARYAELLSRPVFACPWSPMEEAAHGGLLLLADREATLVRDAIDIAAHLKVTLETQVHAPEPTAGDALGRRVLRALGAEPRHPDLLAARLALPIPTLQHVLLELVLSGLAEPSGSGYRRVSRRG